jgi:hypothetical protein
MGGDLHEFLSWTAGEKWFLPDEGLVSTTKDSASPCTPACTVPLVSGIPFLVSTAV